MTQDEAFEILKMGKSVFLTGPAGSGKTFLLNKYIDYLRTNNIAVGIAASTGIASTHINGRTIHSWTGLKVIDKVLSRKEINARIKKLRFKEDLIKKYNDTNILIIDEISMLDAQYLDMINLACQSMRQSIAPFGGMQIVLCGDFFQLPPVSRPEHKTEYAYKSEVWRESGFKVCYLSGQQRSADKKFIDVLNDIRHSQVGESTIEVLESRIGKTGRSKAPTRLYTVNKDVDAMNDVELAGIQKPACAYQMRSYYKEEEHRYLRDQLIRHCMAPYMLVLKVGAVVMFVKNNFEADGKTVYVNGTLGKVVDFQNENGVKYPVVETLDRRRIIAYPQSWRIEDMSETGSDESVASITQIPLRLAWAITVHKSQGISLDEAVIDLKGAFEYGMGYVALSRVRSLEGVCLLGLNRKALEVNPEIAEFDLELRKESDIDLLELKKMKNADIKKRQDAFIEYAKKSGGGDLFF
jgi:ATP-dependent DNA helicase PIF1